MQRRNMQVVVSREQHHVRVLIKNMQEHRVRRSEAKKAMVPDSDAAGDMVFTPFVNKLSECQ
jgi:hypothetical protein